MPVDDIIKRIMEDADKEYKRIVSEAATEARVIVDDAGAEARRSAAAAVQRGKLKAQKEKERIIEAARLEARNERISEKLKTIDAAFMKALDKLYSMPAGDYFALLAKMILDAAQTGDEEIVLTQQDRGRIPQGWLDELNKKVQAKGLPGKLTVAGDSITGKGGFILRLGPVETNAVFDILIANARNDLQIEVNKMLFGDARAN